MKKFYAGVCATALVLASASMPVNAYDYSDSSSTTTTTKTYKTHSRATTADNHMNDNKMMNRRYVKYCYPDEDSISTRGSALGTTARGYQTGTGLNTAC